MHGTKGFAFGLTSLIAAGHKEEMNIIQLHIRRGDIVQYFQKNYSTNPFFAEGFRACETAEALSKKIETLLGDYLETLAADKYAIDAHDAGIPMLLNLIIQHLL